MSRAVVLLKTPPRVFADDAYVHHFSSAGYQPYFIEVLESKFCNEIKLEGIIRSSAEGYVGVVVTSNRAAEAWLYILNKTDEPGNWAHIPFYVVGEATARTLKRATTSHPNHLSEKLIIGAAQSGNSESLAQFVLADLPTRNGRGKLLYLTGDKNRDTFNRMMDEGGVDVVRLCVYETMAANNLEESIDDVARQIEQGHHAASVWIVFFAPSSSDFALRHLHRHFRWSDTRALGKVDRIVSRLAAIGSTTADFLHTEHHLKLDAVASKPVAERLVQAICDADKNLDHGAGVNRHESII